MCYTILMTLFGKKQVSHVGVDIGANGIKVVELKKSKGRPQLWTYGIVDRPLDIHVPYAHDKTPEELLAESRHQPVFDEKEKKKEKDGAVDPLLLEDKRIEEYAGLLKTLLKDARVQGRTITASLPVSSVFHAVINFPKMDEQELEPLVRAEVAKMIPEPIDEMQLVFQIISGDGATKDKYTRVLVTAAPRRLIAFFTAVFQKAGYQLAELETEAFALSRSLVGKDSSVSMIVDLGAERTNFFIIDGGLPLTHRSIKIGGNNFDEILAARIGVDKAIVGQIKKDISRGGKKIPREPFSRLLEQMAKEIQYNFDLFLRQTGNENKRPEKIILTGGSAFFPPILDYIAETFPMKVFIGDPWARTIYQSGLKPTLDELGPRMAVAIGLALHKF